LWKERWKSVKIGRGCAAVTGTKSESHCFDPKRGGMGRTESRFILPESRTDAGSQKTSLSMLIMTLKASYSFAGEEDEVWISGLRLFLPRKERRLFC